MVHAVTAREKVHHFRPDDEHGYFNCLLTVLAVSPGVEATFVDDGELIDLAELTDHEEALQWIATHHFDYGQLDPHEVTKQIAHLAKFKLFRNEGKFTVKLSRPGEPRPRSVSFDVVRTKVDGSLQYTLNLAIPRRR